MGCQKCDSPRIISVFAKCSDRCIVNFDDKEHQGYESVV